MFQVEIYVKKFLSFPHFQFFLDLRNDFIIYMYINFTHYRSFKHSN